MTFDNYSTNCYQAIRRLFRYLVTTIHNLINWLLRFFRYLLTTIHNLINRLLRFFHPAPDRQFGPWFNEQVRFPAPRVQPPIIPRGNQQVRFRDNRIVLDPLALQLGQYVSKMDNQLYTESI